MGKWNVGLKCGHRLGGMNADEARGALDAGEVDCPDCGGRSEVTGSVRKGGKGAAQSKRLLYNFHIPPVTQGHANGLVERRLHPESDESAYQWWCRFCDGKKPERWKVGNCRSEAEMMAEWVDHVRSSRHSTQVAERRSATATADAVLSIVENHQQSTPRSGE